MMKFRLLIAATSAASLALMSGCAETPQKDSGLVRYTHIVDYNFVKPHADLPRDAAKMAPIIDSRPTARRYDIGHIPGAISIPESQFDKHVSELPKDKNALVIFYCQGLTCDLSHKSAFKAEKLGYTNIKVYAGGIEDWMAKGEPATVSTDYMKKVVGEKMDILLIDARPPRRVNQEGTIPGAINISDTSFDKETGKLPQDKTKEIIYFCQGFACDLSDKSAKKAMALGYKNVRTYAAGYPAWKAATAAK